MKFAIVCLGVVICCAFARSPPYPPPYRPPKINCGPNQGQLGCDLECSTLTKPYRLQCLPVPSSKCVCNPDFYRTKQGACVEPKDCPETQCPPGSTWDYCASGCQKGPRCDGSPCFPFGHQLCTPGCKCDAGYKVNADGVCVKAEECPPLPSCPGDNEVYNPCVDCEEGTCEDFPRICAFGCLRKGCVCKSGFVRNGDRQCVRKADCPTTKCGLNEVYKTCGSGCGEPKCTDKPGDEPRMCPAVCLRGCFCRDKYARDQNGACVYKGPNGC